MIIVWLRNSDKYRAASPEGNIYILVAYAM